MYSSCQLKKLLLLVSIEGVFLGSGSYSIHLNGRLRLVAPSGKEILLTSTNVQGLLALLASEEGMTRHRSWLQDKLWSEKGTKNGSNSLRQTLHNLKRMFGDEAGIVFSNRNVVALNGERVDVVTSGTGEFLEGLDIDDDEFERWLALERSRRIVAIERRPAPKPTYQCPSMQRHRHVTRRGLIIECTNDPLGLLGQKEIRIGDVVQRSIREMLDFEAISRDDIANAKNAIVLGVHAFSADNQKTGVRVAIYDGLGQGASWAESAVEVFPGPENHFGTAFLNLCHRACVAVTDLLSRPLQNGNASEDPNFLAGAGMRRMYSMLPGSIAEAGQLFEQAYEMQSRGLYLALRAQLAVIEYVESGGQNREDLATLSDELCSKAMAKEGTSSIVLAAVAHARLVFDNDKPMASELSRLSVLANPSNPLAWSSLANVMVNTGKTKEASKAAKTAQLLSQDTYLRFWTEFQFATTIAAMGHLGKAITHTERARALNVRYRPALRYLVGMHADGDNFEAARKVLDLLQRLEPDATPDRFVNDESYPVSMMRSAGLIDPAKFGDL